MPQDLSCKLDLDNTKDYSLKLEEIKQTIDSEIDSDRQSLKEYCSFLEELKIF